MSLSLDKLVWGPSVALVGKTKMDFGGLEEAVVQMGAVEAAEIESTPLNNIMARVALDGGNGDDLAEFAGRQCYRSWKVGRGSAEYHENIRSQGHGSIYEHAFLNFQITGVSRALTHELIRHRVGTGYSQESQRYVDAKDMRFIVPPLLANAVADEVGYLPLKQDDFSKLSQSTLSNLSDFMNICQTSIDAYVRQQEFLTKAAKAIEGDEKAAVSAKKRANEAARAVLPNAAETRLVFSVNLRELRHILTLRGDEPADLEIRRLAVAMFPHAFAYAPHFFADLSLDVGTDGLPIITTNQLKRI